MRERLFHKIGVRGHALGLDPAAGDIDPDHLVEAREVDARPRANIFAADAVAEKIGGALGEPDAAGPALAQRVEKAGALFLVAPHRDAASYRNARLIG